MKKNVDAFDTQANLSLSEVKFVQAESQKNKGDSGEEVSGESGTDQNPKSGFSHN